VFGGRPRQEAPPDLQVDLRAPIRRDEGVGHLLDAVVDEAIAAVDPHEHARLYRLPDVAAGLFRSRGADGGQ
jgi:hypothetical protein